MGKSGNFLIILIILSFSLLPSFSSVKGRVNYSVPIDYTKLNIEEVKTKADFFYNSALKSKTLNDDMTFALNLYTVLTNIEPENIYYALKLGKLYDVIGKNRYAKGQYYHAMGLDQKRPEPYYYLGDFYYDREQYKKALKFYQKAYENGYTSHYHTLYKMGDIYQKFGDTKSALQYLEAASSFSSEDALREKLIQVKNADSVNKEFYRK